MPNHIAILSSLLVGLAATLGTIVIHGFVVHTIVMTVRQNLRRGVLGMRIWVNLTFETLGLEDGMTGRSAVARHLREARQAIEKHRPARILTLVCPASASSVAPITASPCSVVSRSTL